MDIYDIKNLSKGAILDPIDPRDYKAQEIIAGAVGASIDWSKEFRLEEPGNENQGTSLSCVSQAWSYYHWQVRRKEWSRRSLYSRIYQPAGGASLRDGGKELTSRGQATRDEAPDPMPQTEPNMRERKDITAEEEASDIEAEYYSLGNDPDIDLVAYAVANYAGVVFGVRGTNASWQDYTNPKVPALGDNDFWYHAIYGMGFHMHNGQKCIIAKSSWCNSNHKEHHIKDEYFKSGGTFNCWVLIPKREKKMEIFQVEGEQTLVLKNFAGKYIELATSPELYPVVERTLGLKALTGPIPKVSRAEVNANREGQARAGLAFYSL